MLGFLIISITFIIMEFVSWGTHKYIMHGFLWNLHKDHHQVDHSKFTQKNDWFFLIFAIPSIILISYGMEKFTFSFFIGLGIAGYGLAYVIIHEIIIHRRIPILKHLNGNYIKTIRRAHKIHHKTRGKYGATCFGMLIVPKKYRI